MGIDRKDQSFLFWERDLLERCSMYRRGLKYLPYLKNAEIWGQPMRWIVAHHWFMYLSNRRTVMHVIYDDVATKNATRLLAYSIICYLILPRYWSNFL